MRRNPTSPPAPRPVRPIPEQATHLLHRLQAYIELPYRPPATAAARPLHLQPEGMDFYLRSFERLTREIPRSDAAHPRELLRDRLERIASVLAAMKLILLARGLSQDPHPVDPMLAAGRTALTHMAEGALNHASAWTERQFQEVHRAE